MRFQGVDLVVAVLLILPAINAATFRDMILQLFKTVRDSEISIVYPDISDGVRRQPRFAKQIPFPCDIRGGRSASRPDSVHRLRPGDIDVVGALGDSLVAANGAMEEYALGTFIEARGVSWCAGGQGDWRQFLTLPNIMKEFNPNLTGYSTGNGEFISKQAKLNVAFPVAATEDALHQARILVRRIKNDPTIDMKRDWKLVTIFFGANDICSAQCYKPEQFSPSRHALHLRRTLDYLRATLPRTLVNVVPVLGKRIESTYVKNLCIIHLRFFTCDVTVSIRVPTSTMCNLLHPLYCACMHEGNEPDITGSVMSRQYQQAAESLVLSGRYDTTQDFTVVYQPFTELFNAPNSNPRNSEVLDQTLVTYDCFHFSQKGHALGGNLLWNNLLEPVGNKTDHGKPRIMERLVCPSARTPYIFTNVNSRYYYETGNQEGISPR